MSAVKKIKVKNRLAAVVRMPGGKTIAEAVAGAEARLEDIKNDCMATLDAILATMAALIANPSDAAPEALAAGLYELSNDVVGIAGLAGLDDMSKAAYSFCDLLDVFTDQGGWNVAAVEVHMNGLKLLRTMSDEMSESDRTEILDGLTAVVNRIKADANPPAA
jgi:hypothetical protein